MRIMYATRAHIREYGAAEVCLGYKGIETGRSMPHNNDNNECMMRIMTRMEQDKDGREGLKKEQQ